MESVLRGLRLKPCGAPWEDRMRKVSLQGRQGRENQNGRRKTRGEWCSRNQAGSFRGTPLLPLYHRVISQADGAGALLFYSE